MAEWQPIETAPRKVDEEILVYCPNLPTHYVAWYWPSDKGEWLAFSDLERQIYCEPTHWMPIPKAPRA